MKGLCLLCVLLAACSPSDKPIHLDAEFARLLAVDKGSPNHYRDESAIYAKYGCGEAVVSPSHVSIVALIENPSAFEGKAVVVDGYYFAKFEHSAIYPHPDDGRNERTEKGLWVLGEVSERDSGQANFRGRNLYREDARACQPVACHPLPCERRSTLKVRCGSLRRAGAGATRYRRQPGSPPSRG